MKKIAIVAALAAMSSHAGAQVVPVAAVAPAPAGPQSRMLTLAPNTEIVVTPNDDLTTKSAKEGNKFALSTVFDVMQDGFIVIPRGTPGQGTIAYRTGTGAFGKSGKMEVEFNWLDLHGQRIPLTGRHRQEGEGNTGAAVGAVVAVGVFGAFVKGHSAKIVNGQQLRAHTVEPMAFEVPAGAPQMLQASMVTTATARPTASAPVATPVTHR